jgi:oligopeptide/dipeptide ABC transporter ATP-binding protein
MKDLQKKTDMSIIFIRITSVVSPKSRQGDCDVCRHVLAQGAVNDIFLYPQHPYTRGLLRSMPRLDSENQDRMCPTRERGRLLDPPRGCSFGPRCEHHEDLSPKCSGLWKSVKTASLRLLAARAQAAEEKGGQSIWNKNGNAA